MQAKEKGVTIKHFSLLSCSCFLFSRKRRLGNLTSLSLDQNDDGPYYRIAAFIMIWFDLTRELSDGNDWLAPFRLRLRRIFKLRSNIARIVKAAQCDCNVLVFSIVRNVFWIVIWRCSQNVFVIVFVFVFLLVFLSPWENVSKVTSLNIIKATVQSKATKLHLHHFFG